MSVGHYVLALSLVAAATAGAAHNADDANVFQASYDQEASGQNHEALATLDKLSAEGNASYVAQLRRGWLQYRLGRYLPAIASYDKAIAVAPKAIEARLGILLPLMAEKQWPALERVAREILALDANNYLASLRLAFALYNQGKLAESRAIYQKLVDGYPSDPEPRAGLGWALLKLHKSREAAAAFQAVLDFAPRNTLAQQGMAALAGR